MNTWKCNGCFLISTSKLWCYWKWIKWKWRLKVHKFFPLFHQQNCGWSESGLNESQSVRMKMHLCFLFFITRNFGGIGLDIWATSKAILCLSKERWQLSKESNILIFCPRYQNNQPLYYETRRLWGPRLLDTSYTSCPHKVRGIGQDAYCESGVCRKSYTDPPTLIGF